jgi:type IV secretion system protein VirB9
MHSTKAKLIVALTLAAASALGAEIPSPSALDTRVRYVDYRADDVTVIVVRRGSVTRIVLAEDENIVAAATGFAADCAKESAEWCIRADVGNNQIWVKPRDGATSNNLELKTDRRDYSFELRLLSDLPASGSGDAASSPMFRVIFRYPSPAKTVLTALNDPLPPPSDAEMVNERIVHSKPILRNTRYTMQVLKGAEDIAPSLVFDDGRFTYFRFANNREIPTIFAISPGGEEERINFGMEGDLAVVQRMGRRFVLRLGKAVVGVWNEAFDPDGVPPVAGSLVDGVERTLRRDLTGSESAP